MKNVKAINRVDSRFRGNDNRDICSFSWMDNLDVQKLLDVVSSIIADEYIEVAKRNKNVFMDSHFRGNDNVVRGRKAAPTEIGDKI